MLGRRSALARFVSHKLAVSGAAKPAADLAGVSSLEAQVFSPFIASHLLAAHLGTKPRAMPLIGLAGPIGSGKTTAANYLVNDYGFRELAFARPLKEACAALFGVHPRNFEVPALKRTEIPEWGMTPRHMLQWFGTDVIREHFSEDFLVRRLALDLDKLEHEFVVVSDVRFDNEAELILERGGSIWKLERAQPAGATAQASSHKSEAGIDPLFVSVVLSNNGSIDDLHQEIDLAMQRRGGK